MKKNICLLPGDGIGPEILAEGVRALKAVAAKFGHEVVFEEALIGGAAIDATGEPLPAVTVEKCLKADAVYLASVGGPKWDEIPPEKRPEKGLLRLRAGMGLYSNLRPAKLWPQLAETMPDSPMMRHTRDWTDTRVKTMRYRYYSLSLIGFGDGELDALLGSLRAYGAGQTAR